MLYKYLLQRAETVASADPGDYGLVVVVADHISAPFFCFFFAFHSQHGGTAVTDSRDIAAGPSAGPADGHKPRPTCCEEAWADSCSLALPLKLFFFPRFFNEHPPLTLAPQPKTSPTDLLSRSWSTMSSFVFHPRHEHLYPPCVCLCVSVWYLHAIKAAAPALPLQGKKNLFPLLSRSSFSSEGTVV